MNQIPEIKLDQSVELLKELHILTRDGKLNQDSRRKLKQVYHLFHFIEPLLDEVLAARQDLTLADHGAGKSYLGFIIYDLFLKAREVGHIYDIDLFGQLRRVDGFFHRQIQKRHARKAQPGRQHLRFADQFLAGFDAVNMAHLARLQE